MLFLRVGAAQCSQHAAGSSASRGATPTCRPTRAGPRAPAHTRRPTRAGGDARPRARRRGDVLRKLEATTLVDMGAAMDAVASLLGSLTTPGATQGRDERPRADRSSSGAIGALTHRAAGTRGRLAVGRRPCHDRRAVTVPTDPDRAARALRRASWPGAVTTLDDQTDAALVREATPARRIAMVWQVTLDVWASSGRPLPSYTRAEMPSHLIRSDD
jgi:hypothetical protein